MLEWKRSQPQYNESVKAISFAEDMPEVAKQLQENNNWADKKVVTVGEWSYKTRSWTPQGGGNTTWYVERFTPKPAGAGGSRMSKEEWAKKDADRNARIDKAHQENLVEERRKATALEKISDTQSALLLEVRTQNVHLARIADALTAKRKEG